MPKIYLTTGQKLNPNAYLNPAQFFHFLNSENSKDFGDLKMGADLLLVIRDEVGDRSAISIFNGLYFKKTAIVISQDFLFTRYIFAHEFGHLLGCGHEEGSLPSLIPPVFFAYTHKMHNGMCDLMSNPVGRYCRQGLFFSNPDVKFESFPTGTYKANNALWITNNRYALAKVGNESFVCKKSTISSSLIKDIMKMWSG